MSDAGRLARVRDQNWGIDNVDKAVGSNWCTPQPAPPPIYSTVDDVQYGEGLFWDPTLGTIIPSLLVSLILLIPLSSPLSNAC